MYPLYLHSESYGNSLRPSTIAEDGLQKGTPARRTRRFTESADTVTTVTFVVLVLT